MTTNTTTTKELPEAGGIAYCTVWGIKTDENGVQHEVSINLTSRGFTASEALDNLLEGLKHAAELKLHPYRKSEKVPEKRETTLPPSTIQEAAPETADEPVYGPVAETPDEETSGTIDAVSFDVLLRPDGKTEVSFYAEGLKYPVIKTVRAPNTMVRVFQATGLQWTEEHFQKPGTFKIPLKVRWIRGKEYMPGKYHKDIVAITPK